MKNEKLVNVLWRLWWIALVIGVLVMCVAGVARAEIYALTTVVVSLDYDADVVEVESFNGDVWAFDGCEDWCLFDICSMVMDDNNTTTIYDDIIINCRYNGWFEGWVEKVYE